MAVETPQRILFGRAIILLRKIYLSLIETKPRRSKRIEQAVAADAIQSRDVPCDAGGNEIFVFVANGNLNKALAKTLKQRLVGGVVAIVTRCTAGNQKANQGEGDGSHESWIAGNHPGIMPPLAGLWRPRLLNHEDNLASGVALLEVAQPFPMLHQACMSYR